MSRSTNSEEQHLHTYSTATSNPQSDIASPVEVSPPELRDNNDILLSIASVCDDVDALSGCSVEEEEDCSSSAVTTPRSSEDHCSSHSGNINTQESHFDIDIVACTPSRCAEIADTDDSPVDENIDLDLHFIDSDAETSSGTDEKKSKQALSREPESSSTVGSSGLTSAARDSKTGDSGGKYSSSARVLEFTARRREQQLHSGAVAGEPAASSSSRKRRRQQESLPFQRVKQRNLHTLASRASAEYLPYRLGFSSRRVSSPEPLVSDGSTRKRRGVLTEMAAGSNSRRITSWSRDRSTSEQRPHRSGRRSESRRQRNESTTTRGETRQTASKPTASSADQHDSIDQIQSAVSDRINRITDVEEYEELISEFPTLSSAWESYIKFVWARCRDVSRVQALFDRCKNMVLTSGIWALFVDFVQATGTLAAQFIALTEAIDAIGLSPHSFDMWLKYFDIFSCLHNTLVTRLLSFRTDNLRGTTPTHGAATGSDDQSSSLKPLLPITSVGTNNGGGPDAPTTKQGSSCVSPTDDGLDLLKLFTLPGSEVTSEEYDGAGTSVMLMMPNASSGGAPGGPLPPSTHSSNYLQNPFNFDESNTAPLSIRICSPTDVSDTDLASLTSKGFLSSDRFYSKLLTCLATPFLPYSESVQGSLQKALKYFLYLDKTKFSVQSTAGSEIPPSKPSKSPAASKLENVFNGYSRKPGNVILSFGRVYGETREMTHLHTPPLKDGLSQSSDAALSRWKSVLLFEIDNPLNYPLTRMSNLISREQPSTYYKLTISSRNFLKEDAVDVFFSCLYVNRLLLVYHHLLNSCVFSPAAWYSFTQFCLSIGFGKKAVSTIQTNIERFIPHCRTLRLVCADMAFSFLKDQSLSDEIWSSFMRFAFGDSSSMSDILKESNGGGTSSVRTEGGKHFGLFPNEWFHYLNFLRMSGRKDNWYSLVGSLMDSLQVLDSDPMTTSLSSATVGSSRTLTSPLFHPRSTNDQIISLFVAIVTRCFISQEHRHQHHTSDGSSLADRLYSTFRKLEVDDMRLTFCQCISFRKDFVSCLWEGLIQRCVELDGTIKSKMYKLFKSSANAFIEVAIQTETAEFFFGVNRLRFSRLLKLHDYILHLVDYPDKFEALTLTDNNLSLYLSDLDSDCLGIDNMALESSTVGEVCRTRPYKVIGNADAYEHVCYVFEGLYSAVGLSCLGQSFSQLTSSTRSGKPTYLVPPSLGLLGDAKWAVEFESSMKSIVNVLKRIAPSRLREFISKSQTTIRNEGTATSGSAGFLGDRGLGDQQRMASYLSPEGVLSLVMNLASQRISRVDDVADRESGGVVPSIGSVFAGGLPSSVLSEVDAKRLATFVNHPNSKLLFQTMLANASQVRRLKLSATTTTTSTE